MPMRTGISTHNDHRVNADPVDGETLSLEVMQKTLHELEVHQIELALQNEELRRTKLELEVSRERYVDLYDLAPVGYCTVNAAGLIREVNFAAASMLGVVRSDLVNRPISRFIAQADVDIYHQCHQQLQASRDPQSCELRMVKHDGFQFWVQLSTTMARDAAGEWMQRLILNDISEMKRFDQALQEKNAELELARQVADKANQAKSEFLSSMSHELRSPLNAILGFAQLLESGTPLPTAAQQNKIDQILRGGWYLLSLINDILDLSLIESNQLALDLQPLSLAEVLLDCQQMVELQASSSAIRLSFPTFTSPCLVIADATRLKQVIVNLISNAIKYNRAGGSVTVSVSTPVAAKLRLSVHDTGEGLSSEKLCQLFQPFNRLGQDQSGIEGTGIGLVVSRRLTELMGGTIGVQSTVGVGSVFWIELSQAVALGVAASSPAQVVAVQAMTPPDPTHVTVLYVEDNQANRELVEQLLARRSNLHLLMSPDAASGIALARQYRPQVILMDINLPGISGVEALKILRQDPVTRHIPVLAISANAMPLDVVKGLSAGFFRYLTKPIKLDEFSQALDLALAFASQEPRSARV